MGETQSLVDTRHRLSNPQAFRFRLRLQGLNPVTLGRVLRQVSSESLRTFAQQSGEQS